MENNDLNSTQNPSSTLTPQSTGNAAGASDSDQFQKSADAGTLNQNKPVSVSPNGQPITSSAKSANATAATILFVVVSSVVLLLLAWSAFRWIMKRPETPKEKIKEKAVKEPEAQAGAIKLAPKKGKKKQSRRHR